MVDDPTKRVIEHFTPPDGRPVVFVPLGLAGEKGLAVIFEDDLEMMVSLGLSLKWNRHHRTGIVTAPAYKASGGNVQVARVLLDLGPAQNVTYRNGDPTDLRRDNLMVVRGNAIRWDRRYLTAPDRRQEWGETVGHVYL